MDKILGGRSIVRNYLQWEKIVTHTELFIPSTNISNATFSIGEGVCLDIIILAVDCDKSTIRLTFELEKSSQLKCVILSENCKKFDGSVETILKGEWAISDIGSFFYGKNSDGQKFSISQTHDARNSKSSVISKTILDDSAVSEFYGKINISEIAENSNARQCSSNVLWSNGAQAISCPDLHIANSNVMCSHGATVGAIDDDIMFYMMSRGIGLRTCKQLVAEGTMLSILAIPGNLPDE
ncbi:MAG: SufD family Fe-S cluster assembly protein [Puniceicoccales bacterium]|jgi:Fe-S cluster assembly scaffold protein SufB|nr:SufD family Fe-S cluster assembly protein [Puniceicoccales bacterium]